MTVSSSEYLSTRWRSFAIYVNRNRAIPAFSDGLKQGQRIALWLMRNKESKQKTVGLAGGMAESLLYVHGDTSAQDSISALAAPYMNNLPLLKGHGNFGTLLKPTGWSDARYTEVSKPKYLDDLLFEDIKILPMVDNFDGSRKMPDTFLPIIPLVLLNGQKGVGVGFGSHIFPRAMENIVQATLLAIENKPIPEHLFTPVYAYNGNNTGKFVEYSSKNAPRWEFHGEVEITNSSTAVVTRLPSVTDYLLEDYKEFLNGLIDKGVINDYDDHSTKHIKIVVKFARGSLKDKTPEQVMSMIGLIKIATENIVVVGASGLNLPSYRFDETHKYPNPIERLIREWVEWRFRYYEDRYKLAVEETIVQLNYLHVLKACFNHKLPDVFLSVKNKTELKSVINNIAAQETLVCDNDIEDRICDRASYSWTTDAYQKLLEDIDEQDDLLAFYQDLLSSEKKRRNVFKVEVENLKKIKLAV